MWLWLLKMILKKADHSVASGAGLESFGPGRGFACLKFSVTTKMNTPKLGCHYPCFELNALSAFLNF